MDTQGRGDTPRVEDGLEMRRSAALSDTSLRALCGELAGRIARTLGPSTRPDPKAHEKIATPEEIDRFCDALIADDTAQARAVFDALRASGRTPEAISLGYLAAAARRLGERWTADDTSFLEVTLGSARLHGLQRAMRNDFTPRERPDGPVLRALFTPVPGETHVLGVTMAADFFRRAGWEIELNTAPELSAICAKARLGQHALIGLSAGCEATAGALTRTVTALRDACPDAKIALGGMYAELQPQAAAQTGVDLVTTDVSTATLLMRALLAKEIAY